MAGIIDVHQHLLDTPGYADDLLRAMDACGIERAGLSALGEVFQGLFLADDAPSGCAGEADVTTAVQAHPDRFFGYVYVRPGFDGPEKVRRWAEEGFIGAKFHVPKEPYNHREYWPLYEACQDARLVCLFHTGIVSPPKPKPGAFISSANMQPVHLDPVANDFPDLAIILAHAGVCWVDEAVTMARIISNVYFDISGGVPGWRGGKTAAWWQEKLWWEGAKDKMLFGSDVGCDGLRAALDLQLTIVDEYLAWDEDARNRFLRGNAERLFFSDR